MSAILIDIARASKGTFYYIEEDDTFVLSMSAFSLRNGINDLLRYHARINGNLFLTNISGPLGDELVKEIGYRLLGLSEELLETGISLLSHM